jgi:hypothetical protein
MIVSKVYRRGAETLVAACDADLLGQTFRSEGLRIHVSSEFYEGDECTEEGLVNLLRIATIANLVGKQTVDIAVSNGFVDSKSVLVIGGVPHAQMARMV